MRGKGREGDLEGCGRCRIDNSQGCWTVWEGNEGRTGGSVLEGQRRERRRTGDRGRQEGQINSTSPFPLARPLTPLLCSPPLFPSPFPLPSPSTHNVENSPRAMFHTIITVQKVADRIRLAHVCRGRDRFARHIVLVVEVFEFVVLGRRRRRRCAGG